jgi:hypothetical protein
VLLRGLPVQHYSDREAAVIYWGVGTHFGSAVYQNVGGDLLGHVSDFGKKWGELGVRGYETNGELIFHTDFSDMVGLLCLRRSQSGGFSRLASSISVHNELLAWRPDLLAPLYRGFRYIKREAVESDSPVTENVPVFGYAEGRLSCRIVRERIDSAYRRLGQPLDALETEALNMFASIAGSERVCLNMDFQAGDMQFLNNYTILHSRTAYVDGDRPELKRYLMRLWLSAHGRRRPLAANFPQSNGYGLPGMAPPVGATALGLAGR